MNGRSIGENIAKAQVLDPQVIRSLDEPVTDARCAGAVLRGNLAPDGAVIKPSAASKNLLQHSGRALVVFDSQPQMLAAMADPELDCDEHTVLVLRNAGPVGAPGHARVGQPADPEEVAQGRRARRHAAAVRCAHERHALRHLRAAHRAGMAAVGGPLALVRTGDVITLDVAARTFANWRWRKTCSPVGAPNGSGALRKPYARGFTWLYQQHVTQAHEGCDFDFPARHAADTGAGHFFEKRFIRHEQPFQVPARAHRSTGRLPRRHVCDGRVAAGCRGARLRWLRLGRWSTWEHTPLDLDSTLRMFAGDRGHADAADHARAVERYRDGQARAGTSARRR